VRLVKLAMVDGFALNQTAVKDSWQHYLGDFLHGHLGQQQLFKIFEIQGFFIQITTHCFQQTRNKNWVFNEGKTPLNNTVRLQHLALVCATAMQCSVMQLL